ncbi:MAG: ABC transporter permease [Chloroflexota bacterium]|nr:ABC transporter permease [Chloroflexota bacterium]
MNEPVAPPAAAGLGVPTRTTRRGAGSSTWLRRRSRDLAPLIVLLVLVIFFSLTAPTTFLAPQNLRNILAQVATLAVVSTGVTFVLLLGEIDLSIASMATMTGVIATMLYEGARFDLPMGPLSVQLPMIPAVLVAWLVALALGAFNGLVATRVGVPTFMTTLAMLQITDGIALYWTKGSIKYTVPPVLTSLGSDYIGPIPAVIVVAAVVLLVGHLVLTQTRFGRYVYMTGASREAAELSGVSTRRVVLVCFALTALLAGLAGMLNVGRLGSAQAYGLSDMLLDSIAAVVLGGTSLFGGEGGIPNTIIGLLIFGVLNNGLNLIQVDIYLKPWVRGVILLLALIINVYALRLRTRANR